MCLSIDNRVSIIYGLSSYRRMAESVYVGSIVTEDGLTELLDFFSKNAYRAKAKSTDRRVSPIGQLTTMDACINNHSGWGQSCSDGVEVEFKLATKDSSMFV